jgi:hypothetical protein
LDRRSSEHGSSAHEQASDAKSCGGCRRRSLQAAHAEKLGFGAAITDEQVKAALQVAQLPGITQGRGWALAALSRDSETLASCARQMPDAFLQMYQSVCDFHEHAKAMRMVGLKAKYRLMWAAIKAGHRASREARAQTT